MARHSHHVTRAPTSAVHPPAAPPRRPQLFTRVNEFCKTLCRKVWSPADAKKVVDFIEDEYIVHM